MTTQKTPSQGSHAANPQRRPNASPLLQSLSAKIQAETAAEAAQPKVEQKPRPLLHKIILLGVLAAVGLPMIVSQFSH